MRRGGSGRLTLMTISVKKITVKMTSSECRLRASSEERSRRGESSARQTEEATMTTMMIRSNHHCLIVAWHVRRTGLVGLQHKSE